MREKTKESSGSLVTNPRTSIVEALSRFSAHVEKVSDCMFSNMFSDVMSDNVSNALQKTELLQGSQPNSSRASSDSAYSVDDTATNLGNVGPPLNASVIALGDWPNSNREQATSSSIKEWVENMSVAMTLVSFTPGLSIGADAVGSGVLVFQASKNSFVGTAVTPSGNQLRKRKTRTRLINDLFKQREGLTVRRMSETAAIMTERDGHVRFDALPRHR